LLHNTTIGGQAGAGNSFRQQALALTRWQRNLIQGNLIGKRYGTATMSNGGIGIHMLART